MGLINRWIMRLVLLSPAARAVQRGLSDGMTGMTPQDDTYYYQGGYRYGRAKYLGLPRPEPWTPKHERH